ncbi:glycosyltransferase family 2 protein [Pseudomonas sp. S5D5]|uniref:glycosyltransferase family 2 protein n=1 Tax=Pseudomonas sp. S5D5 TaxID=2083056 RepID=UPI000D11458D|nr:glycosyltransferase family 2 protein [Pseudomonas sp. S5D5]
MEPLVSILIPTNNRPDLVVKAIVSALNQSYKNIEVIVTDNSETDETQSVIRALKDDRLKYIKNEKNIGPVLNWRKALTESSGEFCILLPDDDYLINPFYVAEAVEIAQVNNVDLVITNCLLGYPDRILVGASRHVGLIDSNDFIAGFWKKYHIPTISNLFRKSAALKLDAFSSNDILYSDIELWIKIMSNRDRIYCYEKPSVYYLFHSTNIVTNMSTESLIKNSKFLHKAASPSVPHETLNALICRYISFVDNIYNISSYSVTKRIFAENNIYSSIPLHHAKTLFARYRRMAIASARKLLPI